MVKAKLKTKPLVGVTMLNGSMIFWERLCVRSRVLGRLDCTSTCSHHDILLCQFTDVA